MTAQTTDLPATTADDYGRSAASPTQIPAVGWKEIAIRSWKETSKDNIGIVAAGVAFYGFLALVPLLGAMVLTYGLVASPETVLRQAQGLTSVLPVEAAELIGEQLMSAVQTSGDKKGLGLLAAMAVALWGARNAAGSIFTALNITYEEEERRGFSKVLLLSLLMTAAAVILAIMVGGATAVLAALQHLLPSTGAFGLFVWQTLTYLLLALIAAGAAATLYRYGPSREKATWAWLTPGSIFFAVVWIVLTLGFGFYVRNFGSYGATYGSLSAVVVLLTWLYLSSYVLLFGAELNSEVEHQTENYTTATQGDKPLGARNAWSADHVAGEDRETGTSGQKASEVAVKNLKPFASPRAGPTEHPYLTSRVASRAGRITGARKIGMLSSGLATLGLGFLKRRGREKTGAVLLATAAGLALMRRN